MRAWWGYSLLENPRFSDASLPSSNGKPLVSRPLPGVHSRPVQRKLTTKSGALSSRAWSKLIITLLKANEYWRMLKPRLLFE